MKTNKELGAVYLEVDGLDKERFKELTKCMRFYNGDVNSELSYRFIENYIQEFGEKIEWIGLRSNILIDNSSKLITLDELEQLLKPKKDMKIDDVVVISREDYQRFVELESKEKIRKIEIQGCLMKGCKDVNYSHSSTTDGFSNFELITLNYGGRDIFKAKNCKNEDIILFGKWNNGLT